MRSKMRDGAGMNGGKMFAIRFMWRGTAGVGLFAACMVPGPAPDSLAEETTPSREEAVQKMLEAKVREAREEIANDDESAFPPLGTVVVYADTEDPADNVEGLQVMVYGKLTEPRGSTTYRLFPFREAYARRYDVAVYHMCFKPDPPYEDVSLDITVKEGEVTNLGRVVFKKAKAEGSASLRGTVTDMYGKPMPGVLVSAGKKKTETAGDGSYRMDGFGLEKIHVQASKEGYFGRREEVSIRNMDNREIQQDLQLFRPCAVVLRYAVSARESESFSGLDIERGELTLTLDAVHTKLWRQKMPSPRFQEFVDKMGATLVLEDGRLRFEGGIVIYQEIAPDTLFDTIERAPEYQQRSNRIPRCPLLAQGDAVVIRGFSKAVFADRMATDYCVKVLVEKLAFADIPPDRPFEASPAERRFYGEPDE